MAAKKRELAASAPPSQIDAAEALIRDRRSLPRARLPGWKLLSPAGQAALVEALVSRGLEPGEKGALRVPLREQVRSLARGGARVPLAAAKKRLGGGSTKDRDVALAEACKDGALHLVVRTKVETLVGDGEAVLDADDIQEIVKAHAALSAVLKVLGKKGPASSPLARVKRTLLVEDARSLLSPLAKWAGDARKADPSSAEASVAAVLEQIRLLEEPPIALVWIPDLVKSLSPGMPVEEVHEALFLLRQRAIVELRPESGVGRLSPEDAALCPAGPGGVPLSHVRSLSPA